MSKSKILTSVHIALMAVVITLCSWLTVPFAVPFTMQTFGIYLTLSLLGSKKGTASILIYVLLGAAGVPVFSGFGGGIGYLMGPTGGYIIGFIICGVFYCVTESFRTKPYSEFIFLAIGTLLCYISGTLWFMLCTSSENITGFVQAILLCTVPYIIPDAVKLILALQVSKKLRPIISKNKP